MARATLIKYTPCERNGGSLQLSNDWWLCKRGNVVKDTVLKFTIWTFNTPLLTNTDGKHGFVMIRAYTYCHSFSNVNIDLDDFFKVYHVRFLYKECVFYYCDA